MARIPPIKRLTTEDYKDQGSWISKLLSPLNEFMTSVVQALNKGLTFSENMAAQVKEIEFTQSADVYPIKFQSTLSTRPIGLWIVGAVEVAGNPSTLSTAVWADWEYINGEVRIRNISGLTNGLKYKVRCIIIAG